MRNQLDWMKEHENVFTWNSGTCYRFCFTRMVGMTTDRILHKIQLNLIELANDIQRKREQMLRATPRLKRSKEIALQDTCDKLSKVFKELGYDKTTN